MFSHTSFCSLTLGYGETATAYYIRCHHCKKLFEDNPALWKQWEAEFRNNEERIRAMGGETAT